MMECKLRGPKDVGGATVEAGVSNGFSPLFER